MQTIQEYETNLHGNIKDLVQRLKTNGYRAKPVKRVYIPKGDGKQRPLGLPSIEDKLLQRTVVRILNSIYEQDFLPTSFGYRPGKDAHKAKVYLQKSLMYRKLNFVVEADIRGFFDNVSHDWLLRMLEIRIDDRFFVRLIKKWLKAGILDTDGTVSHPATGTPQGGIISPVLANIYLHYALDLWFEKKIRPRCRGDAIICRYADDFVCAFRYESDAFRFHRELQARLAKFNLETAPEKTKILRFSRFELERNGFFDFLGFEYRWVLSRNKKKLVRCRTSRIKLRKSLASFKDWIKENRHMRMRNLFQLLNSKLRGYYNYYGIIGNSFAIGEFYHQARRILFKWLNRRSQRKSYTWKTFNEITVHFQMERPRITEKPEMQMSFSY